MQILSSPQQTYLLCENWRNGGNSIALVPTMGFLHAGHESLISTARTVADRVVVSIFVNPAQFGPGEDLHSYPRSLERDCKIAEKNGADLVFAPEPEYIYNPGHSTWVEVPALANCLCGLSRPTHFRGVCTIVLKLFMITYCTQAIFGQKDWQQQAIIKKMVEDLNLPVQIITVPIQRDDDGLALSSRNSYLSEEERRQAPHLHAGLKLGVKLAQNGERESENLKRAIKDYWVKHLPLGKIDYLEIVNPATLQNINQITGNALIACALRIGQTRLIDNATIEL